jgi:integrase
MSVYRRGKTYWYKFWFATKLIRESAKTSSITLACAAEKQRRRELERGYNGIATEERSCRVRTFKQAVAPFLADYKLRRRPSSVVYMKSCIDHLAGHLGDMMIIEIGTGTVAAYQAARIAEKASPKTINEEVMVLLQVMREPGDLIRAKLKRDKTLRLSCEEYQGRALTVAEVAALYDAAEIVEPEPGEKKDLKATRSTMILPAIALALNATLRDSEVRTLTWDRLNFLKGILTVGRSKTAAGTGRTIPINSTLRRILEDYRTWYEAKIGAPSPERFVFPYGKNHSWDPDRPVSTFKTAWTNVRTKAGVQARFHDLRHTAITNLLESGAPAETVRSIAGHVSQRMMQHYAHIRTEAKRTAVEGIAAPVREAKSLARAAACLLGSFSDAQGTDLGTILKNQPGNGGEASAKSLKRLAPQVGLEPTTLRLTALAVAGIPTKDPNRIQ